LFRCYNSYAIITVLLFVSLTIAYDFRTGSGKYTILSNGHYDIHKHSYKTIILTIISVSINKLVQIIMFVAYLVYFYKFKKMYNTQTSNLQYDRMFFKIAIAMGATIGLSTFVWMLARFVQYLDILIIIGCILDLIQQCVIMTSFLCTKKFPSFAKTVCQKTKILRLNII